VIDIGQLMCELGLLFWLLCNDDSVGLEFGLAVLFDSSGGEASNLGVVTIVSLKIGKREAFRSFNEPAGLKQSLSETLAATDLVEKLFCNA
jgi:hypothetical protein